MWCLERFCRPMAWAFMPLLIGCQQSMAHQPAYRPYAASSFFSDGASGRVPPAGTLAQGELSASAPLATGLVAGQPMTRFPVPVTLLLLQRGQARYGIYCAPCHGLTGQGDGMIVQRGFPRPPSFHAAALRAAPVGHFVDVIAHGFGVMYPYGDRVAPLDRWAIAAYLRALQRSRHATISDVPPGRRGTLKAVSP